MSKELRTQEYSRNSYFCMSGTIDIDTTLCGKAWSRRWIHEWGWDRAFQFYFGSLGIGRNLMKI